MAFLGELNAGILILFLVLEVVVNIIAIRAASNSLPGFVFTDKKAIPKAGAVYSALHIVGGFFLSYVLTVPIFSGTGLAVGYFVDVGLLFLTTKIIKEFQIKETEAYFSGAFLMIFGWSALWFLLLMFLGIGGFVDLRPITTI
jgi:hypothetical protein